MPSALSCFLGAAFFAPTLASSLVHELSKRETIQTPRGVHVPLYRKETNNLQRRGEAGAIGLGNYQDVTYNVLIRVGDVQTPVVLDTGSSDLWVISDACTENCTTGVPLYPQATFKSTGLDARLLYGDSRTGTHAFGTIGRDSAGVAGLILPDQYFAAINNTNTSVLLTGSAGIFGLGFPVNSYIWRTVFKDSIQSNTVQGEQNPVVSPRRLPDINYPPTRPRHGSQASDRLPHSRQEVNLTPAKMASYPTTGPLVARHVALGTLDAPMFTVSLQRDTVHVGGNLGMLSIGELPGGVKNESLTWTPVRSYPVTQGGLMAPPDTPQEVYPLTWEIEIEDVLLDGEPLPRSSLLSPRISNSALLDTGNSLIRGPSDIVQIIRQRLRGPGFPCSEPHSLTFKIGGQLFPVDPRDFATQQFSDSVEGCTANIVSTDAPEEGSGYLYSWSLGDPFLKGVLASFYYGNLTHPSVDPPRIGLLSTVPANADDLMKAAVKAAKANGGNFPVAVEEAPAGTLQSHGTDKAGVPQAAQSPLPSTTDSAASPIYPSIQLTALITFIAVIMMHFS